MYFRIGHQLRERFPSLVTVIGVNETGPSKPHSSIATFRAQNRELTDQFVAQIRNADIVVADLTHNNPNVHVELGIALVENKNVLRVTGRSVTELGFDIRNLEVAAYDAESDLLAKITKYLRMFFRIKGLGLSSKHGALYFREPRPLKLDGLQSGPLAVGSTAPPTYVLRDGTLRASFEIRKAKAPDDWFGVYFRAGISPLLGSHLVYVRQNGAVELAVYPGPQILQRFKAGKKIVGRQALRLEFENEWLEVSINGKRFSSRLLSHQSSGRVHFAAWQTDSVVRSAEMISRDTIV